MKINAGESKAQIGAQTCDDRLKGKGHHFWSMHIAVRRFYPKEEFFDQAKFIHEVEEKGYVGRITWALDPLRQFGAPRFGISPELITHPEFPETIALLEFQLWEQRLVTRTKKGKRRRTRRIIPRINVTVASESAESSFLEKLTGDMTNLLVKSKPWDDPEANKIKLLNEKFKKLSPTGHVMNDPNVFAVSNELYNEEDRKLAIDLKKAPILFGTKLENLASHYRLSERKLLKRLDDLVGRSVAEKIYVAYCCDKIITVVDTEEKKRKFLDVGVVCPACENPISEEKLLTSYRLTKLAEMALEQSVWLVALICMTLRNLGCEKMVCGRYVNGDEIDILAHYAGQLVLFECKDSSFDLGDAYKFRGKISFTNPDFGIVVTTESVSPDCRPFFEKEEKEERTPWRETRMGYPVLTVEGKEGDISGQLKVCLDRIARRTVARKVSNLLRRSLSSGYIFTAE